MLLNFWDVASFLIKFALEFVTCDLLFIFEVSGCLTAVEEDFFGIAVLVDLGLSVGGFNKLGFCLLSRIPKAARVVGIAVRFLTIGWPILGWSLPAGTELMRKRDW